MHKKRLFAFVIFAIVISLVTVLLLGFNVILNDTISSASKTERLSKDPCLILVNQNHPVPNGYQPDLIELNNGALVDKKLYPDLQNMFDDMRREGLDPIVAEGYRTNSDQQKLMAEKVSEFCEQGFSESQSKELALEWVAKPGTSEHELGLALDINSQSGECEWGIYSWLASNAHRYGFILRYPEDKKHITGIHYEPWHYRYVGHAAAEEMYAKGVTLEEY